MKNKLRLDLEQFTHTTDTSLGVQLYIHDVLVDGVELGGGLLDYVWAHFGQLEGI